MRKLVLILAVFSGLALLLMQAAAQPPGGKAGKDKAKNIDASSIVTALMAFDKDKTGKVTKAQVTDVRLHRLFDQADVNKDGVVTREELIALAAKLEAEVAQEGGGKGGPDGPGKGKGGKKGGPDGKGFGGPKSKGPGDFGGPPQPGQIFPSFLQDQLNLS